MGDTKCRICEAETPVVHYGIGACRACAVFYRRTRARKTPFICKNKEKCAAEGNHLCKKCRFDKIELLFAQKRIKRGSKKVAPLEQSPPTATPSDVQPTIIPCTARTDEKSIIEKLQHAYRLVCTIRRTTELCMRTGDESVQPMNIASGDYELLPNTPKFMNDGSRIMSTALIEFAVASFDEFSSFSHDERWLLVRSFQKPFHITDSSYRSIPAFGKAYCRHFTGYTRFMDIEYIEQYTAATGTDHLQDAIRASRDHHEKNIKPARIAFDKFAACEEELAAMLGLLFWNIDMDQPVRQELLDVAERNRTRILEDLRRFYHRKNLAEYGKRMGELLCMCNYVLEKVSKNKESFEVARLLDVFTADSFAYNMQRNY